MRIFPLGDNAITVEFGNEVSLELNQRAIALAEHFRSNPFAGLIEAVPAYASTTFFYSIPKVKERYSEFPTAFDAVKSIVMPTCDNSRPAGSFSGHRMMHGTRIPPS